MLTISTAQTFASNWLSFRLGGFQIARPELAVRLHTSNAMADFARDDVDVAVRMGPGPWPGLRQHFLFCLYSTPLCTPDFRDRHRLERPEDLLRVSAAERTGLVVEAVARRGRGRPRGRAAAPRYPARFAGRSKAMRRWPGTASDCSPRFTGGARSRPAGSSSPSSWSSSAARPCGWSIPSTSAAAPRSGPSATGCSARWPPRPKWPRRTRSRLLRARFDGLARLRIFSGEPEAPVEPAPQQPEQKQQYEPGKQRHQHDQGGDSGAGEIVRRVGDRPLQPAAGLARPIFEGNGRARQLLAPAGLVRLGRLDART